MHDKHPVGCVLHAAQPGDELVAVCMGRSGVELDHFRPHGNVLPVNAYGSLAVGKACATGSGGLVACQDDHVAVVARVQRQVVQHTAARGHAAGCQDDHGAMQARQAFGLFWGLHHRRAMLQRVHFPGIEAVFAQVVLVQPRGADGHGAVEKHLE